MKNFIIVIQSTFLHNAPNTGECFLCRFFWYLYIYEKISVVTLHWTFPKLCLVSGVVPVWQIKGVHNCLFVNTVTMNNLNYNRRVIVWNRIQWCSSLCEYLSRIWLWQTQKHSCYYGPYARRPMDWWKTVIFLPPETPPSLIFFHLIS